MCGIYLFFFFKDCIAKIHQADNFYDKILFLLTLSFLYSSDYFLWVNHVYMWVNQCMYSFHLGNIPESEFNSRSPVMLNQGPLWDWASPAPAWGTELLCSDLPPVLCCTVTTCRWFLLSFIFSRWIFYPGISASSWHCRDRLIFGKNSTTEVDTQVRFSKPFLYFLLLFPFLFPLTFCAPEHNWMDWVSLLQCSLGSQ